MRVLIIGPDEQAAIRKLVAYAMDPQHFFLPGSGIIPGDDPNHVVRVPDGYRCVFTLTKHERKLFRHLSISVPRQGMMPSPEACVALAKEFGFTSSDDGLDLIARIEQDGWLVQPDKGENCIVMVQPTMEAKCQISG